MCKVSLLHGYSSTERDVIQVSNNHRTKLIKRALYKPFSNFQTEIIILALTLLLTISVHSSITQSVIIAGNLDISLDGSLSFSCQSTSHLVYSYRVLKSVIFFKLTVIASLSTYLISLVDNCCDYLILQHICALNPLNSIHRLQSV